MSQRVLEQTLISDSWLRGASPGSSIPHDSNLESKVTPVKNSESKATSRTHGGKPAANRRRSSENEKCLQCEFVRCIDLLRRGRALEGGELSVLAEELKSPAKVLPCLMASPLQACCRLWSGAHEMLGEGWSPLLDLVWQCMYDLKSSIFLALTAHYRSATQLLRPVIENLLVGLYFESKLRSCQVQEESDSIYQDFLQWEDGKYSVPFDEVRSVLPTANRVKTLLDFGFLVEWLHSQKILGGKYKSRLEKLEGTLNRHLHPYFPYTDVGGGHCSSCPGLVSYDAKRYREWLRAFQNVTDSVISAIRAFHPRAEETENGKDALDFLQILEGVETADGVKAIACPYFRASIRGIGESGS